jgi:hypothetical protein
MGLALFIAILVGVAAIAMQFFRLLGALFATAKPGPLDPWSLDLWGHRRQIGILFLLFGIETVLLVLSIALPKWFPDL